MTGLLLLRASMYFFFSSSVPVHVGWRAGRRASHAFFLTCLWSFGQVEGGFRRV